MNKPIVVSLCNKNYLIKRIELFIYIIMYTSLKMIMMSLSSETKKST